jgi:Bacterial conjugation TrbI-like protein
MTASTVEPKDSTGFSPEENDYDFSDFSQPGRSEEDKEELDLSGNETDFFSDLDLQGSSELDDQDDSDLHETSSEDDDFVDPRMNRTRVGITSNPVAKFGLVSTACLVLVVIAGIITNGISSTKLMEQPKTAAAAPTKPTGQDEAFPQAAAAKNDAALKTDLAFAQQTEANQALTRQGQTPQASPVLPAPPIVRPTAAVTTAPAPAVSRIATPTAAAPVAVPSLPGSSQQQPQRELSPIEQWQAAASVGSFGSVTVRPTPLTPARPVAPVATTPVTPPSPMPSSTRAASGTSISQLRSTSSIPGLRNQPLVPVLVGTTAIGQLETEVVMTGDTAPPSALNFNDPAIPKYLIRLTTELKDSEGTVAIPANSTLVAVVRSFSAASGSLQLEVRSVIANNKEYTVTPGAIAIRSDDGGMLIANRMGRGGRFLDRVALPVFAGLAQAGQTLSQPSGSTTTNGSSTTTTNSGGRNPGAAFVSGAFGNLSDQLSQEAEQRSDRQSDSAEATAWRLKAGDSVQVFVNSSFEM